VLPKRRGYARFTRNKGRDFPVLFVNAKKARTALKADCCQVQQKLVDGCARRGQLAAHRLPNPHNAGINIAA
jgi:hypothetical protein